MDFVVGQRWHSLTEPELGLGIVEAVDGRQVVIAFPARDIVRRYATEGAPLARSRLTEGKEARGKDGTVFRVEEVVDVDGVLVYRGEGEEITETALDAEVDVATPENRLRSLDVDAPRAFDLRQVALTLRHRMSTSPARGFFGGRIRIFDHQLAVVQDACERHRVRVLLADEVGLGKTIEALLILHRLLLSGRVERALVLVPPALVHQWLAEAWLKFNLVLRVIGRDTHGGGTIDLESADLPEQLRGSQLFICPLGAAAEEALAGAAWDIVIVDEAHHLEPETSEFALVEALAGSVDHVVLLSATPDRDGETAHFRRLALLDPARFHDEAAYRRETEHYRELADTAERLQRGAPLEDRDHGLLRDRLASPDSDDLIERASSEREAQRVLLSRLLDLHGIGRVMFRNVRARIAGFPQRVLGSDEVADGDPERLRREFLHDIGRDDRFRLGSVDHDPRATWLRSFLAAHRDERVLVLCSSRAKVEAFAKALATPKYEVARFHSEMSSIERDRQAAWFLAPDGPQVLISSAIGAEGRNFQVARNLVLLDLPLTADRLEQLIGRVDRIGQGEEVRVFVPVVAGSPQHRLRSWYDEALHVFDRPWHGSPVIDREFSAALVAALLTEEAGAIHELIGRARRRNDAIIAQLEKGRDRLLELASFDLESARELRATLEGVEAGGELEALMVGAFDRGGLDVETIGRRSYVIRTGLDYHRPFPGMVGHEMGVTFDREVALEHPERTLLTRDHPMVRDTIDTMLGRETGNASIAKLVSSEPGLLLESIHVVEPTLPKALRADRFMPPTPIRIVVDITGRETELDAAARARLEPTDTAWLEAPQVTQVLADLVEQSTRLARQRSSEVAAGARDRMHAELVPVAERLTQLALVNPSVSQAELDAAREELASLDDGLARVRVRLDALRLIIVAPA